MPSRPMRTALLAATLLLPAAVTAAETVWAAPALSPVPAPGVHPRVILSPEDLPAWKERLTTSAFGMVLLPWAEGQLKGYRGTFEELAALPAEGIPAETVARLWIKGESRNAAFFAAAALGIARDDAALRQLAIQAITGYCRLTLRSKELGLDPKQKALTGDITGSQVNVWSSKNWDLGTGFLFGGVGLALTYDVLYNEMTPEQRTVVRKAITTAIAGRRNYGLGQPASRAISNHTLYHGHLAVMAMAVEGEEGADPELIPLWKKLVLDYMERSFYPSGAANEDTYPVGTSLRDSAVAMVGLARRGADAFAHPNQRATLAYTVQNLQPWEPAKGTTWDKQRFRGHGAGSSDGYPSIYAAWRFMYPQNPLSNHLWRWQMGEDYRRNLRGQSLTDLLAFPVDYDAADPAVTERSNLHLPLSAYFPERGLQVVRSDWTDQALYVHFDARADAFFNGHDNADRGTFTLDALGRAWAIDGDWMGMRDADEHSLVRVDGKTQAWKPPSARTVQYDDRGDVVLSAADLTYSYRWQWSAHSPWPKATTTFPAPWEHETSDPRALGFPDRPDLAWVPKTLYGLPEEGFDGLFYWRKPNLPVTRAFRSLGVRRGTTPYLVVADDLALEGSENHTWDWLLQLDLDLRIERMDDTTAVLAPADTNDGRRLQIHALSGTVTWSLEEFKGRNKPGKGPNKGTHMQGKRLIASCQGPVADFRMVLIPVAAGATAPAVAGDAKAFTVGSDAWSAVPGADGRAVLKLTAR